MPNPRGTRKGDLHHLEHGLYYSQLKGSEGDDLPAEYASLEQEITLLRVMIRRTMRLADGIVDLREAIRLLDALGSAASRLATLLRAQKYLMENRSKVADEISNAIQQVNQELRSKP
jgi:predicted  nucleic acid-binding Zn-ribbon protein